jgi:predicted Ser/Thr protein kinase
MSGSMPDDLLDRVAESLRELEDRSSSIQSAPPRYEVLGEISRGGMGIIYRAWDPQLGRNVALKVLRSEGDGLAAEAHERFQREAKLAANLDHPHIVKVYDSNTWNGQDYIAMQLIEGSTLEQAKPDRRQALVCVRDAARALHYAHEQGIIHRDVKPSNLLVDTSGRVYVTDFGIARHAAVSASITSPGTVVGTPAYMSPEQAMGMPTDARSDVYSLGATLYDLVVGRPPIQGTDAVAVLDAVRTKDPEPPCRLLPDLSKNVEAIILGAMERAREERYPSASALADDIDRYLGGERPMRRPRGISYRVRRQFVRHPWRSTAAIVFCALLLGAAVLFGYWVRGLVNLRRARETADLKVKKGYLKIAEPWFSEAGAQLAKIAEMEIAIARQIAQQEAIEEQRKKDLELQQKLKQATEAAGESNRRKLIAETVASARKHLDEGRLEDARASIETLRSAASEQHAELLPRLRALEFDVSARAMKALAAQGNDKEFAQTYAELSNPVYRDIPSRNARLAELVLQLALRLKEQKKLHESLRWFDEAQTLGAREARLYEQRGLVLLDLEQWERAQKDLDDLLLHSVAGAAHPPEFARLSFRRGHQALMDKDWSRAIHQFEITFYFDRRHAAAHHDRGLARFHATGLAREALVDELQPALEAEPKLVPDPEYREVALAFSKGQTEKFWVSESADQRSSAWRESVRWLDLILDRTGRDPRLILERARQKRRLGDYAAAAREAEDAGDGVDSLLLRTQIAYVRALSGERDEPLLKAALDLAGRAAKAEPSRPLSRYWEGLCLYKLGKRSEALETFRSAAVASLDFADVRYRTALIYMELNQPDEALDAANKALVRLPSLLEDEYVARLDEHDRVSASAAAGLLKRDSLFVRATARHARKEFKECIADCEKVLELSPTFTKAFIWKGYANYGERRYKEAKEDFEQAVRVATEADLKKHAAEWREVCRKVLKE